MSIIINGPITINSLLVSPGTSGEGLSSYLQFAPSSGGMVAPEFDETMLVVIRIAPLTGDGPYTINFVLPFTAKPTARAILTMQFPNSANPSISIFNGGTADEELLTTLDGHTAQGKLAHAEFYFDGTNWTLLNCNYVD